MNEYPNQKPIRQYYQKRPGVVMRVRIPPPMRKPCMIWDLLHIRPHSHFPSRSRAKKHLWKLCEEMRIKGIKAPMGKLFEIRNTE